MNNNDCSYNNSDRQIQRDDTAQQHVDMEALLDRLEALEKKMDTVLRHMERATGAWLFVKIIGSIAIGFTIVYNFAANLLGR